jgi:hypothetical protein
MVMDGERFEEHRRRILTEAEERRLALQAQAAKRRTEAQERRAEFRERRARLRVRFVEASRQVGERAREEALRRLADEWDSMTRPKRRRRRPDVEDGGVPVSPDRPRNLSGGAAAALDFENG